MEAVARRGYDDRIVMARTFTKRAAFGMRWRDWFCVIDQKRNTAMLFHLAGDSQADVAAENPELVRMFRYWHLRRLLEAAEDEGRAIEVDLKKLSKEEIENLKSLGYL